MHFDNNNRNIGGFSLGPGLGVHRFDFPRRDFFEVGAERAKVDAAFEGQLKVDLENKLNIHFVHQPNDNLIYAVVKWISGPYLFQME